MTVELVSFANLKNYLSLSGATINEYPDLAVIKDSVVYAIEAYLDREIESKARSETIYINSSTQMLKLCAIPISSVASLSVEIDGESETYSSDDYTITEYGLKLYTGISNAIVSITYTGGLSTIPSDIERAALIQTAYEFQTKDNVGAKRVRNDGGSVETPELGLLKETKRMLNKYIHPMRW